jgi:hypothetical protein
MCRESSCFVFIESNKKRMDGRITKNSQYTKVYVDTCLCSLIKASRSEPKETS